MNRFPPEVIAAAQAAEKAYYPLGPFVSVSLAQWALESNYGLALSGANNPFGIKANQAQIASGQCRACWTHETINGNYIKVIQYFASYPDLQGAFMAHAHLLATSPYYVKAQHAATPDAYAEALQGVYATGIPGQPYGASLIAIMKGANLYQYDVTHTG